MNYNKGKLMRIEYGKVERLKVCVEHICKEEKDKAIMLIKIPENINESYYEYFLFRNNLYHIDRTSISCLKSDGDNKNAYVIFYLTRTPFSTDSVHLNRLLIKRHEEIEELKDRCENLADKIYKIDKIIRKDDYYED